MSYELAEDYTQPDSNGIVTVSVRGIGNYTGSTKISYRYVKPDKMLKKVGAAKIANKVYTGKDITLTDADLGKLLYTGTARTPVYLVPGTDFLVESYSNNMMPGNAKVTVRGIGAYGGMRTLTFRITPVKREKLGFFLEE